jgi:predicted transcriptional regulator
MINRNYQKKKILVEKFIKKNKKTDYSVILNEVNIDYDTLIRIISDLRKEGRIK